MRVRISDEREKMQATAAYPGPCLLPCIFSWGRGNYNINLFR
jgi:hypothetical protein